VLYSKAVEIARSTALVLRTPSYIAIASIVDGVLPTSDKRRSLNAGKVGIEVYYLIEEKAG